MGQALQQQGQEKRRAPRYQTNTPAKIKNAFGGAWFSATILNLSKTGACVSGIFSKKTGGLIELLVHTREGRDHFIVAQIVWIQGEKAGVKFHS